VEQKIINISLFLLALVILALSFIRPSGIRAQYYSQNEEKRAIIVDKKIRALPDKSFFDNIDKSQKIFLEGDFVEFSITVQNNGNNDIENVKVVDLLPRNLTLMFYPGVYNKTENSIEWSIDKIKPSEIKYYLIRAKITKTVNLPINTDVKMINSAEARVDNVSDKDTASYFVNRKSVPTTGNNILVTETLALLTIGISGMYLRKLARGY